MDDWSSVEDGYRFSRDLERNAFQAFAFGILKVFWMFASYGSWSISKVFKYSVLLFNGDKASLLLFGQDVKPLFGNLEDMGYNELVNIEN